MADCESKYRNIEIAAGGAVANTTAAYKIIIEGVVQGVGFRPFVFRLANRLGVSGWVQNAGGTVCIEACASEEAMAVFCCALRDEAPENARITRLYVENVEKLNESTHNALFGVGFAIRNSADEAPSFADDSAPAACLPPDLSLCPDCLRELNDPNDRRYRYPFISCQACGPRYSIMTAVPYDRQNTTLSAFPLCPACAAEYHDPAYRRFHAETTGCPQCGPSLFYRPAEGAGDITSGPLSQAVSALRRGDVVAVKGVGGYHYACSAGNDKAVTALRTLKGREQKPFAVMFRDEADIARHCRLSHEEAVLLQSPAHPIVLLRLREHEAGLAPSVLQGNRRCGCFLPYTGLHYLLLAQTGPLVMTSANVSGSAILYRDEDMLAHYNGGVLYHNRPIRRSVEDAVVQWNCGGAQLLRPGRGYAPVLILGLGLATVQNTPPTAALPPVSPANTETDCDNTANRRGTSSYPSDSNRQSTSPGPSDSNRQGTSPSHSYSKTVLALGGDLKAAFCLATHQTAYLSQYFGDLEDESVWERYQAALLDKLWPVRPQAAVCDLNPAYFSTRLARQLPYPVQYAQHHHAHIASVMAEHGLRGPVIGVAFDGTGDGGDGTVWGGEFLLCRGAGFERAAHLRETPLLGGDSAAKDARKTAACYLIDAGVEPPPYPALDTIRAALRAGVQVSPASSMGRLFDAAASLLGLCHANRYEGQCAVCLQQAAELALDAYPNWDASALRRVLPPLSFSILPGTPLTLDERPVLTEITRQAAHPNFAPQQLALSFHLAVAQAITQVCGRLRAQSGVNTVALSGGVFQNTLLCALTVPELQAQGFAVYMNRLVPPNDSGLALGQAYLGLTVY